MKFARGELRKVFYASSGGKSIAADLTAEDTENLAADERGSSQIEEKLLFAFIRVYPRLIFGLSSVSSVVNFLRRSADCRADRIINAERVMVRP
jgi:hypothetical protein